MTRALSTPPVLASGVISNLPQPVLPAAGGLMLRPWESDDAPVFLSAYQDEEIRRWHTRRPRTEADVRGWFEAYREDWKRERGGHWAIASEDGAVLGRIATRGWDFDDGLAGMAYWVLPTARGAGVATSAVNALSEWALGEVGFYRLYLIIRRATRRPAESLRSPATCSKAPSAALRCTTTGGTTCIFTPAFGTRPNQASGHARATPARARRCSRRHRRHGGDVPRAAARRRPAPPPCRDVSASRAPR